MGRRRPERGRAEPCACGRPPPTDVSIRPVPPARFEALGEITAQAYLVEGLLDLGAGDPCPEQPHAVERRAAEVLDADGRLLGGVTYVAPGRPWTDVAEEDEAEFRMPAVSPEARGRGADEALVRARVDRA